MGRESIVMVAQIGTGLATLALAGFHLAQIILQIKALNSTREDAERELSLSSYALFQEHLHSITNESLRHI